MVSTFRRRGAKKSDSKSSGPPSSNEEPQVFKASSLHLSGTKPWTGGIRLTSTGLRDWDQLLGPGGQPLGTCLWVEDDRWTHLSLCLLQYWCAEGLSQKHHLVIPEIVPESTFESVDEEEESPWERTNLHGVQESMVTDQESRRAFLNSLPRNLHIDKHEKAKAAVENETGQGSTNLSSTAALVPLLEEEQDAESQEDAEAGLKIAWQYRKSVQDERSGKTAIAASSVSSGTNSWPSEFCHSYDLQGRLRDQLNVHAGVCEVPHSCSNARTCGRSCGVRLFHDLCKRMESLLADRRQVVRLLFRYFPVPILSVTLPLLLVHIRQRELPVVVLVAVRPWTCDAEELASLHQLRCTTADAVFEIEGFAARREYPPPPEFRLYRGLLKARKVATSTAATGLGSGHFADVTMNRRPAAAVFGLQRDRRKLHISMLHIPPEEFAQGGGSVGSGGVRSGAGKANVHVRPQTIGLGCATTGGDGVGLDF